MTDSGMLTSLDLVHLPYSPDLTQAGIHYARRAFPPADDFLGEPILGRLQRLIARKAAELSFRRYLSSLNLPFESWRRAPFTDAEQYDVALGRRRCVLQTWLINRSSLIYRLQQNLEPLLHTAVLVPEEQLFDATHSDLDVLIFAFVMAHTTAGYESFRLAQATGQTVYLLHPLPARWVQPAVWAPLQPLTVMNAARAEQNVELGGLDGNKRFITELISLPAGSTGYPSEDFHAIFFLHMPGQPSGRLDLHCQRLGVTHQIKPTDWGNLWMEGVQVTLAGWMTRGDFRQHAARQSAGRHPSMITHPSSPHHGLLISQLHPLSELIENTRLWAAGKTGTRI